MKVTAIRTDKIVPQGKGLIEVLERSVTHFKEQSILAITSKIVALCSGSVVPLGSIKKEDLIQQEADYYLPASQNRYGVTLTIKNNILIPSAGIDESNADGYYVLWPKDAQQQANEVREYLCRRFSLKKAGVIITDSTTTPLRWGTKGIAIAHSGFQALNDYIGQPDLFGRRLKMTKATILDGLGAAAVLVMGEGDEQTPLAIIEEIPFCHFQTRNPTKGELQELVIEPADDLYAPLLQAVDWQKGKGNSVETKRG